MGTAGRRRERVRRKGSKWRPANWRRPLQTTTHQRRHTKPFPPPTSPVGPLGVPVTRGSSKGAPTTPPPPLPHKPIPPPPPPVSAPMVATRLNS